MSARGWLWVLFCSACVVAANVVLRLAIDRSGVTMFSGGLSRVASDIVQLLREPRFLPAVGLYGLAMLVWLRLLKTEPLSVAYPVLAALTFVAVSAAGILVFGEPVKATRLAGLGCMLAGLVLLCL